jgi:hypothetical protein
MLVDKRREEALKKSVLPWGIAVQIKRQVLWQKLLIIIGIQIPVLLLYLQIRLVLNSIE